MLSKIVTLTTDFGLKDPYVSEMKAVILGICPSAVIVDITHDISKFNIRMGAYMLASVVPYFPKNAIHVAVVDPGVGTRRLPILIQTPRCYLVGPDNGLLVLAAEKQGIKRVHKIINPQFMSPRISQTFHGRDIFAPIAGHLLNGIEPKEFGPEIHVTKKPKFAKTRKRDGNILGEILHVDGFGNIITNIKDEEVSSGFLRGIMRAELSGHKLKLRFCKNYGEGKTGEPLALIGSHGFLEIALNQESAADKFKIKMGAQIIISNF